MEFYTGFTKMSDESYSFVFDPSLRVKLTGFDSSGRYFAMSLPITQPSITVSPFTGNSVELAGSSVSFAVDKYEV